MQATVEVRLLTCLLVYRAEKIYQFERGIGFPVVRKLHLIDDDNRTLIAHRLSIPDSRERWAGPDAKQAAPAASMLSDNTAAAAATGWFQRTSINYFFPNKTKEKNERREDEEEKHNHQRITKSSFQNLPYK